LIKEPLKTTDFHTTCKVNSHVWHKVGFCTAWSSRSNIILCFGLPSSLQNSMSTFSELQHGDPFALHTLCIEKVLLCYDTALWAWRDCVREIEQACVQRITTGYEANNLDPCYRKGSTTGFRLYARDCKTHYSLLRDARDGH